MWPKLRDRLHFEFDERSAYAQAAGQEEPPVPGTGESVFDEAADATPPGDTTVQQPDHGPVPYSRFKEVNDRRRQYEEAIQPFVQLEQSGYGVEDLHRLVAWEQEYRQDPVDTWLRTADDIENLPDPVKQAISLVRDEAAKGNVPADGTPPAKEASDESASDEPPEWGRILLRDLEDRKERETREASDGLLQGIISAWETTDKELGIRTPKDTMLAYIQSASANAGTPQELFVSAHQAWMSAREEILNDEVKAPATGTVPRSVPGSGGAPPQAPPVQPRTLKEATKAAAAAEAAGRLVIQE
jgi:hypothetical protein